VKISSASLIGVRGLTFFHQRAKQVLQCAVFIFAATVKNGFHLIHYIISHTVLLNSFDDVGEL
jgi:hypothetical protein